MPIFEYKCLVCKNIFEQFILRASQITEIRCPRCQGNENERLFSTFAFSGAGSSSAANNSQSTCHSCSSKNCATCH